MDGKRKNKGGGNCMLTHLKVLRMSMSWDQQMAAEKLRVARTWYSLIENGRLIPSAAVKQRLEETFGMPVEKLLQPAHVEK